MAKPKYHPLAVAVFILIIGMLAGSLAGLLTGWIEAHSIAVKVRAADPSDPLDMLHMFVMTSVFVGFCAGTLLGVLVASIVYLTRRQEENDRRATSAV